MLNWLSGTHDQDTLNVRVLPCMRMQIIHTEARVGEHKAISAAQSCAALSSLIKVTVTFVKC